MKSVSVLLHSFALTSLVYGVQWKDNSYQWDDLYTSRRLQNLCPCAEHALKDINLQLRKYSYIKKTQPKLAPSVEQLVDEIKDVAYNCTKRPECKCPEGYFKTTDGLECLRIGREPVDCMTAKNICSNDFNSRLALVKDPKRLTRLSDVLRQTGHHDDFFWIGLSYNRTKFGVPMWQWEDGTFVNQNMKKSFDLTNDVKKAGLRMMEIGGLNEGPLERVAINARYQGKHWQQESCQAGDVKRAMHKYICEFLMFKVNIKAN